MWGRGPTGSNGTCSALCQFSVTPSATHNQIGPLGAASWVGGLVASVEARTLWVSPRNSPVRLGVSPNAASTLTGVFSQWFEALFPHIGTLGCAVCRLVHQLLPHQPAAALPTRSTIHYLAGSTSHHLAMILSVWPPVSALPTGLDERVFFIYLIVGLPYSPIFGQFWLFFYF